MKGQRDRRDQGTFELQSFWRVFDVVEVLDVLDFPRLLALKGRQITDGDKQRVAPDHGKLIKPPALRSILTYTVFAVSAHGCGARMPLFCGYKKRAPGGALFGRFRFA